MGGWCGERRGVRPAGWAAMKRASDVPLHKLDEKSTMRNEEDDDPRASEGDESRYGPPVEAGYGIKKADAATLVSAAAHPAPPPPPQLPATGRGNPTAPLRSAHPARPHRAVGAAQGARQADQRGGGDAGGRGQARAGLRERLRAAGDQGGQGGGPRRQGATNRCPLPPAALNAHHGAQCPPRLPRRRRSSARG